MEELSSLTDVQDYNKPDMALYSLLISMALDKNYIDVASDSLIRPAVKYFERRRDNYHAFLSYYYLGRVYENAGQYDNALSAFLVAENRIDKSMSQEYIARLHFAKERIYYWQFALDRALPEAQKVKAISKDFVNPLFYIRSCLDIINILQIQELYPQSANELDSLKQWMLFNKTIIPIDYYRLMLAHKVYQNNAEIDSIRVAYDDYNTSCNNCGAKRDTLLLADALAKMGEFKSALRLFRRVHLNNSSRIVDSVYYCLTAANIYKGLKDFDNYTFYFSKKNDLSQEVHFRIFNNDVRFIEERYNNQLAEIRAKRHKSVAIVILALLTMALIIAISVGRARKKAYMRDLKEAQGEYSFIRSAFNSDGSAAGIKALLGERLKALIPYFQGMPTRQLDRQMIRRIKTDNHEFLTNIGLLFAVSYPSFVSALASHGLNAEEIGLCSMYASGFISKELSGILDGGSIYQINCSIRTKLAGEIEGRTLPVWIRELFQSIT